MSVRQHWTNWGRWAAVAAVVVAIPTVLAMARNGVAVLDSPRRLDALEPRVAALEQSNLTNNLMMNNRFDRVDESLQRIQLLLDRRANASPTNGAHLSPRQAGEQN